MSDLSQVQRHRLDQIAHEIRCREEEARKRAGEAIQHKIEIGKRLIEAKGLLPRGEFRSWAQGELGWGQAHISRHMLLARKCSRVSMTGVTSLRMALAAIREGSRGSGERDEQVGEQGRDGVIRVRISGETEIEGDEIPPHEELVQRITVWHVRKLPRTNAPHST